VDPWPVIDDLILERKILPAIQAIRTALQCELRVAIDLFYERYGRLRQTRSDEFTVTPEEYGDGLYT
jgi:hypothetical protein